jgi:virginiamycin B lyase
LEDRCLLTFNEFGPTGAVPRGIVLGPDGNLWVADIIARQIDRIQPNGTFLAPVPLPGANSPAVITAGPAATDPNSVWVTDLGGRRIWRIDASTLTVTSFAPPSGPYGITAAADGNLWFTEPNASKLARLNPVTGIITEFASPAPNPSGITAGAAGDNAVYATSFDGFNGAVARLSTDTLTGSAFPVPDEYETGGSFGLCITAGVDGNVWVGLTDFHDAPVHDLIEGFTPAGTPIGPFPTLPTFADPQGVASAGDGKLYFVEYAANALARFDPVGLTWDGEARYPVANSRPVSVTAGPDDPVTLNKTVWSTEFARDKVAQYVIDGMPLSPVDEQPPSMHIQPGERAALLATPKSECSDLASRESRPLARSLATERFFLQQPADDLLGTVWSSQRVNGKRDHDQLFAGLGGLNLSTCLDGEFFL